MKKHKLTVLAAVGTIMCSAVTDATPPLDKVQQIVGAVLTEQERRLEKTRNAIFGQLFSGPPLIDKGSSESSPPLERRKEPAKDYETIQISLRETDPWFLQLVK